LTATNAEVIL